jgi:hypothetical protein
MEKSSDKCGFTVVDVADDDDMKATDVRFRLSGVGSGR